MWSSFCGLLMVSAPLLAESRDLDKDRGGGIISFTFVGDGRWKGDGGWSRLYP